VLSERLCAISELTEVELFSVTSRRLRTEEASREAADTVGASFRADTAANVFHIIPLISFHYRYARGLIARFDTPLRTLDALHLSVVASEGLELLTLDSALVRSAKQLRMKCRSIV